MTSREEMLNLLARLAGEDTPAGAGEMIERMQNAPKKRRQRSPKDIKTLYSVAVWGSPYIDIFLGLSLPGFLGNILSLPNNSISQFVIHTRPEDQGLFESSSQFQALKQFMPVVFRKIDLSYASGSNKYNVLNIAQSDVITLAREFDAIVFLYADFIWGTGSIETGIKRIAEGYDAVVLPVPPLVREDFIESAAQNPDEYFDFGSGYPKMVLPPRRLVALGKKIMHPLMRDNTVEYENNTANLAYVLWLGPDDDYLIRCFHMHPLILRVQHETPEFWRPLQGTLDEYYVPQILRSMDQIYFVPDSDEAAVVSLTPRNFPITYMSAGEKITVDEVVQWAEAATAPIHRLLFNMASIWHEQDVDQNAWRLTIDRSAKFATYVEAALQIPDSVLKSTDKLNWQGRKVHINRMRHIKTRGSWQEIVSPLLPLSALLIEVSARFWGIVPEIMRRQIRTRVPQRFSYLARSRIEMRRLHQAPILMLFIALATFSFRKK